MVQFVGLRGNLKYGNRTPRIKLPLRYRPVLPGKNTIPLLFPFESPPSKPCEHGLTTSFMNNGKNDPAFESSMPGGKKGCAPKLMVRLVTAVPTGTWLKSASLRWLPLKYTMLRAFVAATSTLKTVASAMRRR